MIILVATDGSKHAEQAAQFIASLPHQYPIEVVVVAVNYAPGIHTALELVDSMQQFADAGRAALELSQQRIARMFDGKNAKVQTAMLEGHPGEALVAETKRREIDLVVMGAVGHSVFDRIMIGSVSDYVATHARCSVLIVRPSLVENSDHRRLKLCVAYDDCEPSKNSVTELSAFEWGPNTTINIVNIVVPPYIFSDVPIPIDTTASRNASVKKLAAGAELAKCLLGTIATEMVESEHVGNGIVEFAKAKSSDLLVLGDTGRGLIQRLFLGSTSRYVLRHAPCSVWISRHLS